MVNRLKGKTALITGVTSGIGKSCAIMLAQQGVNLILVARDKNKLDILKVQLEHTGVEIELIVLDVRDRAAVKESLECKEPDILINNAGLALGLEPL